MNSIYSHVNNTLTSSLIWTGLSPVELHLLELSSMDQTLNSPYMNCFVLMQQNSLAIIIIINIIIFIIIIIIIIIIILL